MNARLTEQALAAAERAMNANAATLRLEETDDRGTRLFHMIITLIEWCDAYSIDFDAAISEVRQHFRETSMKGIDHA